MGTEAPTAHPAALGALAIPRSAVGTDAAPPARRGIWRSIPPSILVSLGVATLLTLAAVLAPVLAPHEPNRNHLLHRLAPPGPLGGSALHPLGTDQLGRDLFSRCLYGLRVSVGIAVLGMLIGCALGTTVGLVSGSVGGWVDTILMTLVDIQISIPFLLITLVGLTVFGTDISVLVILVGIAGWETYARLIRGQVLAIRAMPYVEASLALGVTRSRLIYRQVLPNVVSPLIVLLTLNFPSLLLLESSLSFLGIGVQPPTPSLGRMVGEGRDYLLSAWWVVAAPSAAILMVTLVIQLIGDWLRDILDVRVNR